MEKNFVLSLFGYELFKVIFVTFLQIQNQHKILRFFHTAIEFSFFNVLAFLATLKLNALNALNLLKKGKPPFY
jgi:hypothetical protein